MNIQDFDKIEFTYSHINLYKEHDKPEDFGGTFMKIEHAVPLKACLQHLFWGYNVHPGVEKYRSLFAHIKLLPAAYANNPVGFEELDILHFLVVNCEGVAIEAKDRRVELNPQCTKEVNQLNKRE